MDRVSPKMLTPDVPVMLETLTNYGCGEYLRRLREVDCKRVWIATARDILFGNKTEELEKAVRFFKDAGVETGVWINAFGFGEKLNGMEKPWQRLVSVTGKEAANADAFCPEDEGFVAAFCDQLETIAQMAPDLIMLDDDLCLSVRPGIGCFCPKHRRLIERKLGGALPQDGLFELLFTGAPNQYRDAWYSAMGDSMRRFCQSARRAVDRVDAGIRMGFCAGYTSWTFEGADSIELTRILAGDTRPFLRLTGAPYWVSRRVDRFPGMTLGAVIENARMQAQWCGDQVEFFAEDDSYPRPAYNVPASYIESFDTALHACGVRSLKYLFDYVAPPDYEEAYEKAHLKNAEFRERVLAAFAGKEPAGVRLITPMRDVTSMTLPQTVTTEKNVMREYFSVSAAFLTGLGVPVRYSGDRKVTALFGGDADGVDSLDGIEKLILDLPAALRLQERGIDAGIKSVSPAGVPSFETFGKLTTRLSAGGGHGAIHTGGHYSVQTDGDVLSTFGDRPSAYNYTNGGTEMLVLCFDAAAMDADSEILRSYARAEQINRFIGCCPYLPKTHGIYSICADGALLLINTGEDEFQDFDVVLPERPEKPVIYGAQGVLDGGVLHISSAFTPGKAILIEMG